MRDQALLVQLERDAAKLGEGFDADLERERLQALKAEQAQELPSSPEVTEAAWSGWTLAAVSLDLEKGVQNLKRGDSVI